MSLINEIDRTKLPKHIAVIMDGNGRWARERGKDRTLGHQKGVDTVHDISTFCSNLGIKYLTLYTFSTENWNRPQYEVDALMHLIVTTIEREVPFCLRENVSINVIGDLTRVPQWAAERLLRSVQETAHCTGMTLTIAVSYSSRWEITHATKAIATKVSNGTLKLNDINEDTISQHLATANMPDPDLMIRTAGDLRISNFLLWQLAYSELYFTPVYWPEFNAEGMCEAIIQYQSRQRRYGKTGDQIINEQNIQ